MQLSKDLSKLLVLFYLPGVNRLWWFGGHTGGSGTHSDASRYRYTRAVHTHAQTNRYTRAVHTHAQTNRYARTAHANTQTNRYTDTAHIHTYTHIHRYAKTNQHAETYLHPYTSAACLYSVDVGQDLPPRPIFCLPGAACG